MAEQKTEQKKEKAAQGASKRKKAGEGFSFAVDHEKPKSPSYKPRLKEIYDTKIIPQLLSEFKFKNKMEVPKLSKIVVSATTKDALQNPKVIDNLVDDIALITGQKPVVTKAKKSIATFKLREGQSIGVSVTLRKARMYEFMDRLINIALPRVRDFKGLNPKSFDGRGNYSMGIKEQIIFPEINYDKVDKIRGLNITFVTTAKNNEQARSLLAHFGMPFRK
jgi:large subunit ribosomal protein L5